MFTYFTDRDGKFQLSALAESAFDPLARTTKFMLTEEAHHMFVGESGVSRVIQRTCQVMNELKTDDPKKLRAAGVIDLPTLQRYLNFHYSVTIDLFGADESSNAATFYSTGLKGRFEEGKRTDDHQLRGQTLQGAASASTASWSRRKCRCSTRSTKCCATTTSRTAWPASAAGTR